MLARSEELDRFLGKKFPNLKRYGELYLAFVCSWCADYRLRRSGEHVACSRYAFRAERIGLAASFFFTDVPVLTTQPESAR